MRFTAATVLLAGLAGLAASIPLDVSESAVTLDARAGGPPIDPHLWIIDPPKPSGPGCPPGSAAVIFDKDLQAFTVNFDKYTVATGPAPLKSSDGTKTCKITLHIGFDKGWTMSMLQTDLDGYANLERGVNATAITDFIFTGGRGHPKWRMDLHGPFSDTFDLTADPNLIVSSPCGASSAILNINTAISLNPLAPSAVKGIVGVSDVQGFLTQKFHFKFTRCGK